MAGEKGILCITKKGGVQIEFVSKKGKTVRTNTAHREVSQTVRDKLKELDGQEVEFDMVGRQPKKIREIGGNFVAPANRGGPSTSGRGRQGRRSSERQCSGGGGRRGGHQRHFHNPYNFVPAPPRDRKDPDLGDHRPVGQDRFDPHRYTGRITVRMVAETPLLVPDSEKVQEAPNGHKTFPLRVGPDGKPAIPASSVRGMLRSAYEAVTNSRFGTFSRELRYRQAFRMKPQGGLRLIPARVTGGQLQLLTGTSPVGQGGKRGPMYAAWLQRYWNGQLDNRAMRYPNGDLPTHGDAVDCWMELFQHHRWDRKQRRHVKDFQYWKVRSIVHQGETLGAYPGPSNAPQPRYSRSWHEPLGRYRSVVGWVCVTNANINHKHDERVFFVDSTVTPPGHFPLTQAHKDMWRELVENYQSIHEGDLRRRRRNGEDPGEYYGPKPGRTAWSRHVYTRQDRQLTDGTLCYVRLNSNQTDVEAIFPVMISRELYPVAPWDLLPESLRPAENLHQLSPADRVFGWVRGERARQGDGAVRGLLRVGPVICTSAVEEAVETFPAPGVPLAILSTPKPQQGRFYVAKDHSGKAQDDGLSGKDAGYSPGKGLRGRKVYPHQGQPSKHWQNPVEDRTQVGVGSPPRYQEYRRPNDQRDDQNRSILGWVKPGARFSFNLHVHNLSEVELGALIWLLSLPEGHYLRFGGGKPLGFGSVRLEVETLDVRTGAELCERYSAWVPGPGGADPREGAMQAFREAVVRAYASFEQAPFIGAFLAACRGHDDQLPTHYPRATEDGQPGPPNPEGESFRWFVANNKRDFGYALRDLADDTGLPVLQSSPGSRGGGSGRGGRGRGRGPSRGGGNRGPGGRRGGGQQ